MKLIVVLLLVIGPVTAGSWLCRWYTTFHVVASGTVYCDARRTQHPTHATVTLMDDDGGDGSGDDEAS
ncbi:hypothetical protein AAVH_43311 [Aphelenchoides avenae]|nr:hypothetical protein AAVH_43311 [Aphelenchus avenae]